MWIPVLYSFAACATSRASSSTLFLWDENGKVIGALGLNEDITQMCEMEKYLKRRNQLDRQHDVVVRDVNKLLESLIEEAHLKVGKKYSAMKKKDKLEFVEFWMSGARF